jgi:phenylalanyl-tRNA synthetase beta chain
MKVPLSWLKEFIDLEASPHQIAQTLTTLGLEVEGVELNRPSFENVVIGKVTSTQKHPGADRLTVAQVTDGKQTFQVVCGAPNCREGLKVPFAKVGAEIHGQKVKEAKLRGVESFGMLCSAKDLGLGENHDGLLEFQDHLSVGADVADLYADTVFDVSLTPNLGHAASVLGVARELAASLSLPHIIPSSNIEEGKEATGSLIQVSILEKSACPRYTCRVIRGVKAGPSPDWMQERLKACGIRPINVIVDITNYVQHELGHPLHAFDLNKLSAKQINVRMAKENETIVTLDGKKRELNRSDLVIADKEKAVAIAGVMGGENSQVCDTTEEIVLEAAYFDPRVIRKTAKRLAIQTESSRRFERGADPNGVVDALNRATALIRLFAGGEVAGGIIDIKEKPFVEKVISCRLSRIVKVLGVVLSVDEVEEIFKRLHMPIEWDGQDTFKITIPTYRVDVTAEIDLIEEVARIWGYDRFPKLGSNFSTSTLPDSPIYLFENKVRAQALSLGLQELLTCDLIGPSLLDVVGGDLMPEENQAKVLNPTSIEQSVLRTSLLPGFLQVVKTNCDQQNPDIHGFEVGRIHFKLEEKYFEHSMLALILSGNNRMHHWGEKPRKVDFFDLKGIVENLLKELGAKEIIFKKSTFFHFHPGRQASVFVLGKQVGKLGEVHPSIQKRLDVTEKILFAEIDLHELFELVEKEILMAPLALYPASDRDWTVTLQPNIEGGGLLEKIRSIPSPLLESVSLWDVYESQKLGKGVKNVTYRFVYRDKKGTVSQEAVEKEHAKLIHQCEEWLK